MLPFKGTLKFYVKNWTAFMTFSWRGHVIWCC